MGTIYNVLPASTMTTLHRRSASGPTILSVFTRFFQCSHMQMSLPFTIDGASYRKCMKCGLQRDFDLNTWKMVGPYYRT
jgi:hypothetical protein